MELGIWQINRFTFFVKVTLVSFVSTLVSTIFTSWHLFFVILIYMELGIWQINRFTFFVKVTLVSFVSTLVSTIFTSWHLFFVILTYGTGYLTNKSFHIFRQDNASQLCVNLSINNFQKVMFTICKTTKIIWKWVFYRYIVSQVCRF